MTVAGLNVAELVELALLLVGKWLHKRRTIEDVLPVLIQVHDDRRV